MALDIHVAATEKKAELQLREMFIEESLHDLLFTKYSNLVSSAPCLSRLAEYYGDARFEGKDVGRLAAELAVVGAQISEKPLRAMIEALQAVCKRAEKKQQNIYAFGD